MIIPKYVQEILARSCYEFDCCTKDPNYSAGYTIRVEKANAYTKAETLKAEVQKLCTWANRAAGVDTAYILSTPARTHYCTQYAVVTIFDPIMQQVEKYIKA